MTSKSVMRDSGVYVDRLRKIILSKCIKVEAGRSPRIQVGRHYLIVGQIVECLPGSNFLYKTGSYPGCDRSWDRLSNKQCRKELKSLITPAELKILDLQYGLQQ